MSWPKAGNGDPALPDRRWRHAADAIVGAFGVAERAGMPVYLRLRKCIADLIATNTLRSDEQLPPELWLARALGISLGTVQKALHMLNAERYIQRRQGHGTYVSAPPRPMTELWHYRFVDPATQQFVPVYSRLISRKLVESATAARILGDDPAGFVEIRRYISVAGELDCHSRIYLGASEFAPLMEIDAAVFDNVNLKTIFAAQFGRPTLDVIQRLRLGTPDVEANQALGLARDALTMILTVTAFSHHGPYSYQEASIPRSRFLLDMSALTDARPGPKSR